MVQRWRFEGEGDVWVVPFNPNAMTAIHPTRSVTARQTVRGRSVLFEGATPPTDWSFSGVTLNPAHYEGLRSWVYDKKQKVTITDHFGRKIECVLTQMDAQPLRSIQHYWRHSYTIKALVLKVTAPTVLDYADA